MIRSVLAITAIFAASGALQAQVMERRAMVRGGARDGSGKCTIEVVVDGAAQVEIRGDRAFLRNLNGQPPQWRRFECDSIMPPNPVGFRFEGVDGRGRQTLIQEPNRGAAIVQIEDRDNGQEGYTFDIMWGGQGGYQSDGGYRGGLGGGYGNNNGYGGGFGNGNRGGRGRFTAEQAIQVCEDAIREQARNQFRTNNISFRRTAIDDNPGRNDWVIGTLEARGNFGQQVARFSCSVNFDTGRVRSAQIDDARGGNGGGFGNGGFGGGQLPAAAIQNCQRAVGNRLNNEGYRNLQFGNLQADNQPGRNDWVVGDVRVNGRYGAETLRFSCSVDMRSGNVRDVNVNGR